MSANFDFSKCTFAKISTQLVMPNRGRPVSRHDNLRHALTLVHGT